MLGKAKFNCLFKVMLHETIFNVTMLRKNRHREAGYGTTKSFYCASFPVAKIVERMLKIVSHCVTNRAKSMLNKRILLRSNIVRKLLPRVTSPLVLVESPVDLEEDVMLL